MRRLLPTDVSPGPPAHTGDLDDAALAEAYAYPDVPWLRANMVATADGAAQAPGSGLSEGISGAGDKRIFGVLRGLADAVLVGASTVRKENYGPARPKKGWAEARTEQGRAPVPVIAVVSGTLDLDPSARLFTEESGTPVRPVVFTSASAPPERRKALAEVADVVEAGESRVDLGVARSVLEDRGLTRLLCEGGPRILAQLADARLLDELCLTVTPLVVAGTATRVMNGDLVVPPSSARLGHVLEEDGFLFARYELDRKS